MRRKIYAAVAFCCAVWILGLAGSDELERIGFTELVAQGIPVLALFMFSLWRGGFTK